MNNIYTAQAAITLHYVVVSPQYLSEIRMVSKQCEERDETVDHISEWNTGTKVSLFGCFILRRIYPFRVI